MAPPTSKEKGDALEHRVVRALKRGLSPFPVSRNVILVDRHGNRSEIDVVYGPWWWRTYVECKAYHGSGNAVGLEEVAKFKEVLALNGISPRRGLFVTTTRYVPRARTVGVRTLDGPEFAAWEASWVRQGYWRRLGGVALVGCGLAGGVAVGAALAQPLLAQEARRGWEVGLGRGAKGGESWWSWGDRGQLLPPSPGVVYHLLGRAAGEGVRAAQGGARALGVWLRTITTQK